MQKALTELFRNGCFPADQEFNPPTFCRERNLTFVTETAVLSQRSALASFHAHFRSNGILSDRGVPAQNTVRRIFLRWLQGKQACTAHVSRIFLIVDEVPLSARLRSQQGRVAHCRSEDELHADSTSNSSSFACSFLRLLVRQTCVVVSL